MLSLRAVLKSPSVAPSRGSGKLTSKATTEAPAASRLRSARAYTFRGTGNVWILLTLASSMPTTTMSGLGLDVLNSRSCGCTATLTSLPVAGFRKL